MRDHGGAEPTPLAGRLPPAIALLASNSVIRPVAVPAAVMLPIRGL
jgi:hypothetical protein